MLTAYRRLIIRNDSQAASQYIADYIIGAYICSSLARMKQVTNAMHRTYQVVQTHC